MNDLDSELMIMQLTFFKNDYTQTKKYIDGVFKSKQEIIDYCHDQGKDDIYFVLSFGAGTQSTHLLEEHFKGNIHYDYIVFSDTGAEPEFIHRQVAWWKERQKEYGNTTPFITTHHNSMIHGLEEMLFRYILTDYQRFQMHLYFNRIDPETGKEVQAGMTPRQCTVDFKIIPVKQAVRKMIMQKYGLKPKQRFPENVAIIQDIGFSFDELNRVSTWQSPQYKYIYLAYPLIEKGLTTQDSIEYLKKHGFPNKRSRCYFCPFNCDLRDIGMDWYEIIETEPLSFLKAVWFDEELRKVVRTGKKNLRNIPYFHHSRKPLKTVYEKEYEVIKKKYEKEFAEWLTNWKKYIKKKYETE